jgi:predicted nucleotidyltransferase
MSTTRYTLGALVPVTYAAAILQRSRKQVYRLIEGGELRVQTHGPRATLIERDSLVAALRRRGVAADLIGDELVITEADAAQQSMPEDTAAGIRIPIDMARLRAFCEKWHIVELSLFGSVLREDFRPDSDVDVLVTFAGEARYSLLTIAGIAIELEELLGREVDFLERKWIEESHNPIRKREILSTAREVYRAAA